jgi:hypothetical protein
MTDVAEVRSQPELKRAIGPKLLLFFVIGDILGTGIYALTGSVAGKIGGRCGSRSCWPSWSPT